MEGKSYSSENIPAIGDMINVFVCDDGNPFQTIIVLEVSGKSPKIQVKAKSVFREGEEIFLGFAPEFELWKLLHKDPAGGLVYSLRTPSFALRANDRRMPIKKELAKEFQEVL